MRKTDILRIVGFGFLIIYVLIMPSIASASEEELYNPSPEFLKDFFSSLEEGKDEATIETNSALALRRLRSFSGAVNNNDMVGAWEILINFPEMPGLEAVSQLKEDAMAVQMIIPWYDDKELRRNFISAFEDIWLKNEKLDDYKNFKEVFSGYASRRVGANPAVFIRDNLGFYGYTKGPNQPQEDMMFIWDLFRNFSLLSEMTSRSGYDYHALDMSLISNRIMSQTAMKIDEAWRYATAKERLRSGVEDVQPVSTEISEKTLLDDIQPELSKETKPERKRDFSSLNVFKLPDDAGSEWATVTDVPKDVLPFETSTESIESSGREDIELAKPISEIEPGTGVERLEPPEPPQNRKTTNVVIIPKIDDTSPKVEIPVKEEIKGEEIVEEVEIGKTIPTEDEEVQSEMSETQELNVTEEPLESVFKAPDVTIIEPSKMKPDEKQDIVKIPRVDEPVKTEEPVPEEEIETTEEVDLLSAKSAPDTEVEKTPEVKTIPVETIEVKPPVPETIPPVVETKPPAEETKPASENETAKIARELTDRTVSVGEDLGRLAVNLVILWSNGPDNVKDYSSQEAKLEQEFKVKKEEFLAMLYINDAFKLEEDIGMTFDTFNGMVIRSLMKGLDEFKSSNGFTDNPNITEEELIRAISQLTEGVESRRDSVKIQNSSLRAYRLRRSQFAEIVAKLEKLKNTKLSE